MYIIQLQEKLPVNIFNSAEQTGITVYWIKSCDLKKSVVTSLEMTTPGK